MQSTASSSERHICFSLLFLGSLLVSLGGLLVACGDSSTDPQPRSDAGVPGPDGGQFRGPTIVATAIGQLDGDTVLGVPYPTRVGELSAGLTLSESATVAMIRLPDTILGNTDLLESGDEIRLIGEDAESKYRIQMEILENETVLLVDGVVERLETRFFLNGGTEWIIKDDTGAQPSDTHLCMPADISSGRYEASPNPYVCLEVTGLPSIRDSGGSTADSLVFTLMVGPDSISGIVTGTITSTGTPSVSLPTQAWFHSDRVDTGGW